MQPIHEPRRRGRAMGCAVAMLLILLAPAQAHPESAAPGLRADVAGVGHMPEAPAPGTQWQGHVEFEPGHNVTDVWYQICRVGDSCFAPPTPAHRTGDRFDFDTGDYRSSAGDPVPWGMGDGNDWLVGYKFFLGHGDGSQAWFPQGLAHTGKECKEMAFVECDATHYFVFTMPGAEAGRDVPAPLLLLPLLAALLVRRDRHG